MFGDFSRRTFDGADGYRAVLLQQGRVVLDADVNEQAEITAHHDEVRTRDLVGRHGGPAPETHPADTPGPGPFAIVGPKAGEPAAWGDLRITPGTYYVGGVLCECPDDAPDGGWKLTGQPMAPRTHRADDTSAPLPVNDEPGGRSLAYLDVWHRTVSPDEDPSLLESALGGPDTAVRLRTTWQVRTLPLPDEANVDDELAKLAGTRPWMTAEPTKNTDRTQPTSSDVPAEADSGYRRLDNQLYRVQVHDDSDAPSGPTVLWSRDNGSVVARLLEIRPSAEKVNLVVDRNGHEGDLSFAKDDLIEVTSTDLDLRGDHGYLATVTGLPAPEPGTGRFTVPITWKTPAPEAGITDLGLCPIIRRWDCGDVQPLQADKDASPFIVIDDDIQVTFSPLSGHNFRTGDFWLIPARTVQLAYGIAGQAGRIEWPVGSQGKPRQMPPAGPDHRYAPLAILTPAGKQWQVRDSRRLFATISDLTAPALHLLGGDGQEALPGQWLPQPVRVAVRAGGSPVPKATVQFSVQSGALALPPEGNGTPLAAAAMLLPVPTGDDGVAAVRWLLGTPAAGAGAEPPATQVLTAQLLDAGQAPNGAPVTVTGRLSVAGQVGWTAPDQKDCDGYATSTTVGQVLGQLVTARELILLGGDGQSALPGAELAAPIRVAVRVGGRPLKDVPVTFETTGGHLETDRQPTTSSKSALPGVKTGDSGIVSVRWLLDSGGRPTQLLKISLDGDPASLTVTGHLDHAANVAWTPPAGSTAFSGDATVQAALLRLAAMCQRPSGLHITALGFDIEDFGAEKAFRNDTSVSVAQLVGGIYVKLDGPAEPRSWIGKPVIHVVLDLPWPRVRTEGDQRRSDGDFWSDGPVGTRSVELSGGTGEGFDPAAHPDVLAWRPSVEAANWLQGPLWDVLGAAEVIRARLVIDGWAITGTEDPVLNLNTHAAVKMVDGRADLGLPTDDQVPGGTFAQWFSIKSAP
jgi:hypothetical protein